MEDGATIGVCLELAGKNDVPTALRAFEKIRYERVLRAQKTGEKTRDKWHKADFEKVKDNPESMALAREEWLLNHDAEKHAYKVWEETMREIQNDASPEDQQAANGTLHVTASVVAMSVTS